MEIFETVELLGVIENVPPLPQFFLNTFFPRTYTSQSEYIDFDLLDKGRRLAPFVAPNVQGQPMLQRGYSTRRIKPAYLKPKDPIDPARLLIRQAGEAYGGEMTLQQREDAIVADTLREQRDGIYRRWEWMAAEALLNGAVTLEGENYPTVTVSFGRDPDNTVTLSGASRWSQATTATPITDITNWSYRIRRSGVAASSLILGTNASSAFFATNQVKEAFDIRRGTSMGANLEKFATLGGESLTYHGTLPGTQIAVFTYSEIYEDNMGEEIPFLDPDDVILTGDPNGVKCFGAIMDRKAGWRALPLFPKMWEQEDPSGLFLMSQSAPIMVPLRPNATVKATVL